MFCPRCSTENLESTKYCRQCGLALGNVQLILNGTMEEISEKVKKGEGILSGGAVTLLIFCCVALLSIFLDKGRSFAGVANIILGLLISAPMIFIGIKRLERAKTLLTGEAKPNPLTGKNIKELPTAPTTDRNLSAPQTGASVTEHTTYELKEPEGDAAQKMQSTG
jgi:hypothetical protein